MRSRYFYDALGRRTQKQVENFEDTSKSLVRKFVYDGAEILSELDENNSTLVVYTHSTLRTDDVLAADVRSTAIAPTGSYHYLKDGLGSITDIVNTSGELIQHYSYSSFGKPVASSNTFKNRFTYTNWEWDEESGLYYYRARYYDPGTGRFLTEDPIPGLQSIPATINSPYIYTLNNPVRYTDPEGKILAALAIAFVIGGAINAYASKNGKPWYQNFAVGGAIAAGGVLVGFGGAAAGAYLAGAAGGSVVLGAAIGGGLANGAYSYGVQRASGRTNAQINWMSVGFSAFAGALGGALWKSNAGAGAESIDGANKGVAGGLIDSIEPPPSAPPANGSGGGAPSDTGVGGPVYIPSPM